MTNTKRRTIGGVAFALGLVALMLLLILTALHAVGTDDGLYYRLQTDAGILPETGISDGDLQALDAALAGYLAGDEAALADPDGGVMALEVFGAPQPAFNEREMTHLEDCYGLFALLRKVRGRLIPWAVLLIVGGAYLLRDRRRTRRVAWLSPLILLVPLGAFAIWAAIDFDGAFTFFHRLLFSNDLWLLYPRTDLLIRISFAPRACSWPWACASGCGGWRRSSVFRRWRRSSPSSGPGTRNARQTNGTTIELRGAEPRKGGRPSTSGRGADPVGMHISTGT